MKNSLLFPDDLIPMIERDKTHTSNPEKPQSSGEAENPNQLSLLSPFEGVDIDKAPPETLQAYLEYVQSLISLKRDYERAVDNGDNTACQQIRTHDLFEEAQKANALELRTLETTLTTKIQSLQLIED